MRESFHLLHYLSLQDVPREWFEVIVVEYYSRVSNAVRSFEDQVDTWLLLGMPEDCYYHKHLMYNAGIFVANGDICVICDSDAMVRPGFIRAIIDAFDLAPDMVLHLDQFRNIRKDLYPFAYPTFEEVTGRGCINNAGGITSGLSDERDPIHERNYGACMCARRKDLIAIGGSDEHRDYLGHVCGPYDMTFRLVNKGLREVWHREEFLYHSWHPGQAGTDNYLGPHDGRQVSTTALDALARGRVFPLVENDSIRALRQAVPGANAQDGFRIRFEYRDEWRRSTLQRNDRWVPDLPRRELWHGYVMESIDGELVAYPRVLDDLRLRDHRLTAELRCTSEEEMRRLLRQQVPFSLVLLMPVIGAATYLSRAAGLGYLFLRRRLARRIAH
ncbi:MAG: hypothetical protein JNL33_12230 [Betaproteobacteria bacterium]|nr:hypothetical protein [Betaproteobacteria bacterium]